jgi:superfamily I DNA/RNA helicase
LPDARSYLDYSSILDAAVDVLTNDNDLRKRLAQRVKYVIVDEYQDVNPIQEAIVRSLHEIGARICVVGDDHQTIYQWRGSDIENILTFENRYPAGSKNPSGQSRIRVSNMSSGIYARSKAAFNFRQRLLQETAAEAPKASPSW